MDEDAPELDKAAIERDIAAGAKALNELRRNPAEDWTRWSATILGLRGLRSLAFANAQTSDMKSQAYRNAMGSLLGQRKYSIYDQIDKQTRSHCYKLMDRLEEVDYWYAGLEMADKMRWKHPQAIAKHCPKEYLSGGMRGHNKPKGKKKRMVDAEIERIRRIAIQAIGRLIKHEPDAADLLVKLHQDEPDDDLG